MPSTPRSQWRRGRAQVLPSRLLVTFSFDSAVLFVVNLFRHIAASLPPCTLALPPFFLENIFSCFAFCPSFLPSFSPFVACYQSVSSFHPFSLPQSVARSVPLPLSLFIRRRKRQCQKWKMVGGRCGAVVGTCAEDGSSMDHRHGGLIPHEAPRYLQDSYTAEMQNLD